MGAAEKREIHRQVDARCAEFETVVSDIIDANFLGSNPFFRVCDAEGRPWPKSPREMSPADIREFVRNRFPKSLSVTCATCQ